MAVAGAPGRTLSWIGKEAVLSLFIQFLCAHKQVSAGRVAAYGQWQPGSREPFGSIALRHGLLTLTQVDEVLTRKVRLERFGETASRLGYLTARDVEHILMIQALQDLDDFLAWALVHELLAGSELAATLCAFWTWLETHKPNPWERTFAICGGVREWAEAGEVANAPA